LPTTLPEPWLSFLKELDPIAGEPTKIPCIGGFAVTQHYGSDRTTVDRAPGLVQGDGGQVAAAFRRASSARPLRRASLRPPAFDRRRTGGRNAAPHPSSRSPPEPPTGVCGWPQRPTACLSPLSTESFNSLRCSHNERAHQYGGDEISSAVVFILSQRSETSRQRSQWFFTLSALELVPSTSRIT